MINLNLMIKQARLLLLLFCFFLHLTLFMYLGEVELIVHMILFCVVSDVAWKNQN